MATERPPSVLAARRLAKPRDPNSMVAAAAVMTGANPSRAKMSVKGWQTKAWHFYDEIGELRFGVGWLANAMSRVNLVAATPPVSQGDEPNPIDPKETPSLARACELVAQIAGGVTGQGQLLAAAARQLTVPGLGYIHATADNATDSFSTWRMLSNEEARKQNDVIEVTDPESGEWVELGDNDLLIKVWRSHPRKSWEPDSPVRSVLSSLNEIELLTKRIAAESLSRLCGAGLLLMPNEAEFPPGQGQTATAPVDGQEPPDEFIQTMVQVAQIAIGDAESPAATVPLTARMPGELIAKVQHIKFWSDFDDATLGLREAAVKRLALGLDMPPEVLLGMGDSNHWSAWQIAEEAITLHVEPLAETVVHALTLGYLRAALIAEGLDPESAIVWYDATDLATRPDRSAQVTEAWDRIKISDEAYLRELGLEVDDLPDEDEFRQRVLINLALQAPASAAPFLALAGIIDDAEAESVKPPPAPAPIADPNAPPPADQPADGPPEQPAQPPADDAAPPEQQAASAASVVAVSDVLVMRALERAGQRLRSAAGKKTPGGAAAVPCDDPTQLHCALSATEHASLESLLAGAWERVPVIAAHINIDPASWTACLDGYTRGLLASGHAHDLKRLAAALGVDDARQLVASGAV